MPKQSPFALSLAALCLVISCTNSMASQETAARTILSAKALSLLVGLDVSDRLIVGDLESVKKGEIPLASTIPTTIASVDPPANLPVDLPAPQKKIAYPEEFDGDLFMSAQRTNMGDEFLHKKLFFTPSGNHTRRYTDSPILRPVWVHPDVFAILDKKRVNASRQQSKTRPSRTDAQKAEKLNHNTRGPKIISNAKGKKDYF